LALAFLPELGELTLEAPGQNRKSAPGLRIQALVVDVKGRRVALTFPLVSREQPKNRSNQSTSVGSACAGNSSFKSVRISSGVRLSRIAARSIASSTSYGIKSASSV
jgi:hypothetical protein